MWRYYGQERPEFAVDPKAGEESVWDYPRPPRIEAFDGTIQIYALGELIAQCYEVSGHDETVAVLDRLKELGFAGLAHEIAKETLIVIVRLPAFAGTDAAAAIGIPL